ncbi:hypothetical protein RHSIM_Rhsim09G0021100 [Rhododendron simsii]|uniref:Aminotransferase-like plant mobile domain-containing protein n=1 Tax=Rhododendron simsii TaxID=118357 RepID=A0A834GIX7_RHOSS|nr:hypothetical protein RHSIM_Rhsim09G0021100 [Rhododendron simsii]
MQRICTHVHIKTALKWKLERDDPRLPHIEKAGFGWVRQLTSLNSDQDLVKLFYSRFRPDTCTFLLGGKKYIISLEDVACLTSLFVDGQTIIWKENKDIYTLCENVLGRKVVTRTFVLPNNSGLNVPGIYLTLLEDFEGIRRLSWGSSMLALLIENLKEDPSKSDVVNLGGNAALLQSGASLEAISGLESGLVKQTYRKSDYDFLVGFLQGYSLFQFWVHLRFPAFRPNEISMENISVPLTVKWIKEIFKQSKNAYQKAPLDQWETITNSPISGLESGLVKQTYRKSDYDFLVGFLQGYSLFQFWVHLRFPAFRPNEISMENISVPLTVKWIKEIFKQSKNAYQKAPLDQWETITNSPTVEGPQHDIDWNEVLSIEIWDARWEHIIGELDFEDTAPDGLDVHEGRKQFRDVEPLIQDHATMEDGEQSRVRK